MRRLTFGLAACLLIAASSTSAFAQRDAFSEGYAASDLQFFSPVDFDFDDNSVRKESGWFFNYDKLSWAMTGDRVTIGDPNVQVFSEIIYPDAITDPTNPLAQQTDNPIPNADLQYQIINGLQDVAPTAAFAWGERYEFGYLKDGTGWEFSVLDGPAVNVNNNFGGVGNTAAGFGSIHVNWATPDNFLLGFRDYNGDGTEVDGFINPGPTTSGPAGPGGDGVVDDNDGDGFDGPIFVFDGAGLRAGIVVDQDDLHLFNIRYLNLSIRNRTETQGFELMKTVRLSNRHKMASQHGNNVNLGYGMRFLRLSDEFSFNGVADVMGAHSFTTSTENQLVGPQIRAQWTSQRGRWKWDFDGRCLLAYNITDSDQVGSFGLDATDALGNVIVPGLLPGGANSLISAQPTTFSYGRRDNEFSPTVEVRADLSYQVTSSLAARLGYTGIFVDNISRAAAVTRFYLPDHGLKQGGEQDIFVNGVNFGFDVVY